MPFRRVTQQEINEYKRENDVYSLAVCLVNKYCNVSKKVKEVMSDEFYEEIRNLNFDTDQIDQIDQDDIENHMDKLGLRAIFEKVCNVDLYPDYDLDFKDDVQTFLMRRNLQFVNSLLNSFEEDLRKHETEENFKSEEKAWKDIPYDEIWDYITQML